MKQVSFLRATITNYFDSVTTPYVTTWLVQPKYVYRFMREFCCFRLGDEVEFSGYETFEIEDSASLPVYMKRS